MEEYTTERQARILSDVATIAGLASTDGSTISVTAASVRIEIHLALSDAMDYGPVRRRP